MIKIFSFHHSLCGQVFDRDATLEAIADEKLGGTFSAGCNNDIRLLNTVSGVQLRAVEILPNESDMEVRLLAIASTSPQPFDGVYTFDGSRVDGISARRACRLHESEAA
jgi:hypothetical protein